MSSVTDKPNILVIMADQLTPFLLGAYGHPNIKTPNIDRLASEGTCFNSAYTASPICVPARAGFMTGRYTSRIGCNDNGDSFPALTPTFAHYLTNAGYETTLSGKMHFVGPDQLHGFKRRLTTDVYPSGYDWSYDPIEDGEELAFNFHKQYMAENCGSGWALELQFDEETQYRSLEYLRSKPQQPFALVTSFTSPHPPLIAPKKFWDMYEGIEIDLPYYPDDVQAHYSAMDHSLSRWHGTDRHGDSLFSDENLRYIRRGYYALISYFDSKVGELLDVLEEQGLRDNTAIVLTADHGDMMGEKKMIQKRSFYEWSSRIPMIVSVPGMAGSSIAINEPVSLIDVAPTLMDLAGVDDSVRVEMEGRSLLPLLKGESQEDRDAIAEYHAEGVFRACIMLRKGQFKYVTIENAEPQLFDLKKDPDEWVNLAGKSEYAEVEVELKNLIMKRFDVANITPNIEQKLRKKKIVSAAMHANNQAWDYQPYFDATQQYMRADAEKKHVRT